MTPQSHFTVLAPIADGREPALRALLESMNGGPGQVDPDNAVLPFGRFDRLHFARLVILGDETSADLDRYGLPRPRVPRYLALMGDCDGAARDQLAEMARVSESGLRRLFGHCADFDASTDVLAWMISHDAPVASRYVNTLGRTVRRIREDQALQRVLSAHAPRGGVDDPLAVRRDLQATVASRVATGDLQLTRDEPTPWGWRLANALHLFGVPLVALLLLPFLVLLLPLMLVVLRIHERADPEYCPRPDPVAVLAMQRLEDHDLTNSFTAIGAVKPGQFRQTVLRLVTTGLDYVARHVFHRGFLTRVQTIHFARWVFVDDRQRVLFASSYDGVHESYMDDFINKVGWGLNVVFSNGFGWPHTDWLLARGARREMPFKHYQRRHQVPTQVWYKAYPGLTLHDLDRNQRIRAGFDASSPNERDVVAWLRLL